jgi:methylenetetrahydrofolate reductase (NADPH)
MRIADIYKGENLPVSFEIFPPKGELKPDELRAMLNELTDISPAFISVTCSAGGTGGNSAKTAELSGIIQNEYNITAMAHATCINSTKADVDDAMNEVRKNKLENVFALRGDKLKDHEPTDFHYGAELISYLRSKPEYSDLCIGSGCYPEGHVECSDIDVDIDHLKAKQDAGAEFFISQLFFDNEGFYRFIDKARAKGVTVPIDAGIMPIMGKSQITRMIFLCGASLPAPVVRMLYKYENSPEDLLKAGTEYAAQQILEIAKSGAANGIHIYSMNKANIARYLVEAVRNAGI